MVRKNPPIDICKVEIKTKQREIANDDELTRTTLKIAICNEVAFTMGNVNPFLSWERFFVTIRLMKTYTDLLYSVHTKSFFTLSSKFLSSASMKLQLNNHHR